MMSQRRWAGGRQLLWSPLSDTRGLGPAPRSPRSPWPPPVPAAAFPSPPGPSPTRFSSWVDRIGGAQGRLMSQCRGPDPDPELEMELERDGATGWPGSSPSLLPKGLVASPRQNSCQEKHPFPVVKHLSRAGFLGMWEHLPSSPELMGKGGSTGMNSDAIKPQDFVLIKDPPPRKPWGNFNCPAPQPGSGGCPNSPS